MFKPKKGISIISRVESNHASIANQPATLLSSVATSASLVVPVYYASLFKVWNEASWDPDLKPDTCVV